MHGPIWRLRQNDLEWRVIEDEIVLVDLASSEYMALNGSAALLWKALAEGSSEMDLARLLSETFDVPEEVAREDVALFIAALRSKRLISELSDA
jgi:hypothetical protein